MKKVKNWKISSPRDIKFRFKLGINWPQKRCLKIIFPVLQDDFAKRTLDHYIDLDCPRRRRLRWIFIFLLPDFIPGTYSGGSGAGSLPMYFNIHRNFWRFTIRSLRPRWNLIFVPPDYGNRLPKTRNRLQIWNYWLHRFLTVITKLRYK